MADDIKKLIVATNSLQEQLMVAVNKATFTRARFKRSDGNG